MKIVDNKDSLLVTGIFKYLKNNEADVTNPIKTGIRPVLWFDNKKISTSIQIFSNTIVYPGERKEIKIIILSPYIFKNDLVKGKIFTIACLFFYQRRISQ